MATVRITSQTVSKADALRKSVRGLLRGQQCIPRPEQGLDDGCLAQRFRRAARVRSAFDFFWHRAVVLNVRWSFATGIFSARASAFAVGENVDIFFAGT